MRRCAVRVDDRDRYPGLSARAVYGDDYSFCLCFPSSAIGLLPLLIAKTPLRNSLLSAAIPGDELVVTVGDASLSWFSPPSLSRWR